MKLKFFSLLLITLFTFFVVSDVDAKLRGDAKKALSKAKKLVKSSRSSNEDIIAALKMLENWSDKDITEFLVEDALPELAKHADKVPAFNQAIKTLSKMVDAESQKYLAKQVFNKKLPGSLRSEILYKMLKDEGDIEMIKKGLDDEAWEVRQKTLIFIGGRGMTNDEFVPYLKKLINDDTTSIRKLTIQALNRFANDRRENREKFIEIAEILVARLENDQTATRGTIVKVLKEIAGTDSYGDVYELWKAWLNKVKNGEDITPDENKKGSSITVTYHGIETYSKRLIYIIDTSSSMEEEVDPELTRSAKKKSEETSGDDKNGRKNKGRKIDWSKIRTKFDLAKAELIRSMWALPEPSKDKKKKSEYKDEGDMMFTIIAYNSEVELWKDSLVLANERNKTLAEQWINTLKTGKKTNIYGALTAGFDLAEGKKQKKKPANTGGGKAQETQVDTIFFLTDGYATTGKYFGGLDEILNVHDTNMDGKLTRAEFRKMFSEVFTEEEVMAFFKELDKDKNGYVTCSKGKNTKSEFDESLGAGGKQSIKARFYYMQMEGMLREIAQRNEMLQIEIHTITVGKSSEADYTTMKKLAQMTKGKYVRLGAIDERK